MRRYARYGVGGAHSYLTVLSLMVAALVFPPTPTPSMGRSQESVSPRTRPRGSARSASESLSDLMMARAASAREGSASGALAPPLPLEDVEGAAERAAEVLAVAPVAHSRLHREEGGRRESGESNGQCTFQREENPRRTATAQ